ncbi:MAG: HEPN domain-containing protein [Nitrososphaerota archaeon]
MRSKEMAKSYLEDAKIILDEAKIAFNKRIFHRVVRLCQEATELALKACLRIIAIEYPKNHEVSDVLIENKDKFPEWFKEKIEYLNEASNWLSEKRGAAIYGDEIGGIPALKLFDENDGKKALEYANEVIRLAIKFFEEFYST